MRNALRLTLALGGASIVGAGVLLACSDDTALAPPKEAGADSPVGDAELDAAPDTSPFDGGFLLVSFDTAVADAVCGSLARCCYGTATPAEGGVDGGSFDVGACITKIGQFGFQGSNVAAALKDGGNVVLDQVSADDCIKKVKALACDLSGPEFSATRAACFGVYRGTLGAAAACKGTAECKPGFFCKGQVDGGTGTCTALQPLNGACGQNPTYQIEREEACSYRGGGDTGNYCKFYDFDGGVSLDAGAWKCTAAGGAATKCAISTWCKDTICSSASLLCTTPNRFFDSACSVFIK